MAFGLGAGACFYYIALDGQSPSRFTNGRTSRLEEEFVELTGSGAAAGPLRRARGVLGGGARRSVDAGRPGAAALRPLLPRPLREVGALPRPCGRARRLRRRGRLPLGHRVRRASDDEPREPRRGAPQPSTRSTRSPATCSPCPSRSTRARVAEAAPRAIARAAERMIEPPLGDYEGLPALRRFAAEVGEWPQAIDDWQWCARFNYQVIERRGTGGGNFRLMYSRFLEEVGTPTRRRRRRGGRARGPASRRRCTRRARRRRPSPELWTRSRQRAGARCWTPRSACGRRSRLPLTSRAK